MAPRSSAYSIFRRRLRAARHSAGLTQVETAKMLGKPQSYVSKCESGERRVDVVELGAFSRVYGIALSYFLAGTERPVRGLAEPASEYGNRPQREPAQRQRRRGRGAS